MQENPTLARMHVSSIMKRSRVAWAVGAWCALRAVGAWSFDFVPTEAEWMAWPEYCRAQYVGGPGVSMSLRAQIDAGMIERSKALLGSCYPTIHHYCAGLYRLNRALSQSGNAKAFGLHQAEAEHYYTRENCPSNNVIWSINEAQLAIVKAEAGKVTDAFAVLDGAIRAHPEYAGAYVARARLLIRNGKRSDARATLLEGEKASDGKSAELQYALGLSYFESKEYEKARKYAREAYALGYPLPWLRDRLAGVGYPL